MPARQSVLQSDLVELYRKALLQGMPLEELEQKIHKQVERLKVSDVFEEQFVKKREARIKHRLPKLIRVGAFIVPVAFLGLGIYLVGTATLPIVSYYASSVAEVRAMALLSPIPREEVMAVTPLVVDTTGEVAGLADSAPIEPVIVNEELDYTNLSNWFAATTLPELSNNQSEISIPKEYKIDIPKLNIYNASVAVGGTDLNKSLIAYQGTALPGNPGAPVIFGHSVLRQFYNPSEKNPRRYN